MENNEREERKIPKGNKRIKRKDKSIFTKGK